MNEATTNDVLNYDAPVKNTLPQGLNVLTILTYIGCGILGLFTLLSPVIFKFSKEMMEKATSSGQELTEKQMAEIQKGQAAMELAQTHMVPLMIIGMIGIILCFVGAMWMRKLKKDGYWIYVAGEIAPVIGSVLIMGTAQYNGVSSILLGLVIPVLFVTLYTLQRKYLVK